MLLAEFLEPMGLSQYALAKAISVPPRRINEIVHGLRGISADTALRLGRYFGMEPEFWMNLQSHYDMEIARDELAGRLEREVTVRVKATSNASRPRQTKQIRRQRPPPGVRTAGAIHLPATS